MLKYRLSLLNDYVDTFILVESTHTFSGKDKSMFFEENKHLFEPFLPKIIHIRLNDMPYLFPNIDYSKSQQWENEYHQRNAISRGIDMLTLDDSDIILISDVDEIPDPVLLQNIRSGHTKIEQNSLHQILYYYNLTLKRKTDWPLAKILSYKNFRAHPYPSDIRRNDSLPLIPRGGWHLSYFGDTSFIQNKLRHFSHQEFNKEDILSKRNIEDSINNGRLCFDRDSDSLINIPLEENT